MAHDLKNKEPFDSKKNPKETKNNKTNQNQNIWRIVKGSIITVNNNEVEKSM